jgi:hypothetical protein
MAIVVVHGIHNNVSTGHARTFGEGLKARGFNVVYFAYPYRHAFQQWFKAIPRSDGRSLAHVMMNGDDIVCHSNGALVWQESIVAGAKWDRCLIFAGAATSDGFYYPDDSLKQARIVYNPEDMMLKIGAALPFHPYGKLGLQGYMGQPGRYEKDERFVNVNGYRNKFFDTDHSHYFQLGNLKVWLDYAEKFFRR